MKDPLLGRTSYSETTGTLARRMLPIRGAEFEKMSRTKGKGHVLHRARRNPGKKCCLSEGDESSSLSNSCYGPVGRLNLHVRGREVS